MVENFHVEDAQNPAFFFSQNDTLFPKKFKISNCFTLNKRLDFSDLKVGDNYIQVYTSEVNQIIANYISCKTYKNVKQVILCNNSITHKGMEILLNNMPQNIRELNLKNNQIGKQGAKLISNNFHNKLFKYDMIDHPQHQRFELAK